MQGLTVTQVTARSELAAIIQDQVPEWCDAGTIAELGLLNTTPPALTQWAHLPGDLKLLWLMDQQLLLPGIGPEELLYTLFRCGKRIGPLLESVAIFEYVTAILAKKIDDAEMQRLNACLASDAYAIHLKSLFRQIFHDKIRLFVAASAIHGRRDQEE